MSVKFIAIIKGSITFILDTKTYALVSEFDNHNFEIYFSGRFRYLVDQHDEIRNRFCIGNDLKLQRNKSEPQSMLTQYIQRKFASLGHYKTCTDISVWCTGLHEHNTDQMCLCSDKTGVSWSWLIENVMRHYSKAITPTQLSLFFKADVLSAGRPTSASSCSETSDGCVISTYIFQNQNWPDILFAVLINLHTTSDISLHCTCWWPCTVN